MKILVFVLPLVGVILSFILNAIIPQKWTINGFDILPIFFLTAIELIALSKNQLSFLPYGLLYFFIFLIIYVIMIAVRNKNISISQTLLSVWRMLIILSIIWYIALLILNFV